MKSMNELMETVLKQLELMTKTENVIGQPVEAEGKIILPLCKFSLGFGGGGAGWNPDKKDSTNVEGGGVGGGITVEPIGVVVVTDDNVVLLNVGDPEKGGIATIAEAIPGIVDKIKDMRESRKIKGESEEKDD